MSTKSKEERLALANEILSILGGANRLNVMTGAYNFLVIDNGVSFRIKNPKANYIKITVSGLDLFDLEVGRIRGDKYTVVAEEKGLYDNMLKSEIEKATGMTLTMPRVVGFNYKEGGDIYDKEFEDKYYKNLEEQRERHKVEHKEKFFEMIKEHPMKTVEEADGFKVGDKVTFVNDYGVKWKGHEIFAIEDTDDESKFYLDTDAYWFPHKSSQLRKEKQSYRNGGKMGNGKDLNSLLKRQTQLDNMLTDIKLKSDLQTREGVEIYKKKIEPVKNKLREIEAELDSMGYEVYEDGGKIPTDKSMLHFVLNQASAGMIANRTRYSMYKDIDGIRATAIQILKRDGDREYSVDRFNGLIQEAVLEYDESKSHFSKGGGIGGVKDIAVGVKLGLLNPRNGRYMYSTIEKIEGDEVYLVEKHPTRSQWDNHWHISKDKIAMFLNKDNEDFPSKKSYVLKFAAGGNISADGMTREQWEGLGLNIIGSGVGYSNKVKGGTNKAGDVASGEVIFESKPMFFAKNWNPHGKFVYIDKNDDEYTSREVPSTLLGNKNKFKKGGSIANQNKQMVAVKGKEIKHHAEELMEALEGNDEVPAWVVAKIERSATDISDAAHYLEGAELLFAEGGSIAEQNKQMVAVKAKEIQHHAEELMEALKGNNEVPAWVVAIVERSATDISDAAHYLEGVEGKDYNEEQYDVVELERKQQKVEDDLVELERGEEEIEHEDGDYGIDGFARGGEITSFHENDFKRLTEDAPEYPFYWVGSAGIKDIMEEKSEKKVAEWNPKTRELKILNNDKSKLLKKWLTEHSYGKYKRGGTTFKQKVSAIAKRLDGTEVKREYRKEYGYRYGKKESMEAATKIAGSMVAKSKKAKGGKVDKKTYILNGHEFKLGDNLYYNGREYSVVAVWTGSGNKVEDIEARSTSSSDYKFFRETDLRYITFSKKEEEKEVDRKTEYEVSYQRLVDGEYEPDIKTFTNKEAAENFAKEHYSYVEEVKPSKYRMAKGGKVKPKEVIEEEVYIEYLNKDKGFRKDRKDFKNEKEATEWAQKNFERFDPDMIKYKFATGGRIKSLEAGQVYELPNNEEIKIERLFIENTDEQWVAYLRDGKPFENAVKTLTQFLNTWKAKLKLANGGGVEGGEIIRDMDLHDAVIYEDEVHYISEEDGVIGLKYMKSGAWGSSHPFTPLSEIDVDKDVRDMMGRKVRIKNQYAKGGKVEGEWVVYNPDTYEPISIHKSYRSAKMASDKLFSTGDYESVGCMSKNEFEKTFKIFHADKELVYPNVLNYRESKPSNLSSKFAIDMEQVEQSAQHATDKSKWTNPQTVKDFEADIAKYELLKEQLDNNEVRPSKIVGTGYKPNIVKPLAYKWLNEQIAIAKRAIEILNGGGISSDKEWNDMIDATTVALEDKYFEDNYRNKIKLLEIIDLIPKEELSNPNLNGFYHITNMDDKYVSGLNKDTRESIVKLNKTYQGNNKELVISVAYHRAKKDGGNPELVKAVEAFLD